MVLLSLDHAGISYPGKVSFGPIDFTLRESQHVALTGDNRELIKAILDALAGKAILTGNVVNRLKADEEHSQKRPSVSYLPSQFRFRSLTGSAGYYQQRYNSMDAEDSLRVDDLLAAVSLKTKADEKAIERLMQILDIERLRQERLTNLSNGETKKVRLATAVLQHPRALVLEEPFAGIDAKTRATLCAFLDQIAESGVTIVLSTNNEMPSCIKKVFVAGDNNTLKEYERRDFSGLTAPTQTHIHPELIGDLITSPKKRFDHIVQMTNVSVQYGDHLILDDVNWTVKQGERWALTGPNGAGKSTLLSLINADNPQAFANNIVLFDRKKGTGESIWDIKKNIGYFSADLVRFFPGRFSCLQVVTSGFFDTFGLFRKVSEQHLKVALKRLRLFDLERLAHKSFGQVSANEKKLVLLCRALVKNAPLLILDEPGQGLSEKEKAFLKTLIDQICYQSPLTLIYVSHYANEMPQCINRHLALHKGRQTATKDIF